MINAAFNHRPEFSLSKVSLARASLLSAMLLASASPGLMAADEIRSEDSDQTGVSVTIYNSNLALIKDRRSLSLPSGESTLAFRGVSAQMRAETALLRSLSKSGSLSVIEQNFDYDLLTPQKLLEKYVGKQVRIARMNPVTGKENIERATVLSTQGGVVLKIGDRIETGLPGRIIYDEVPDNLRDKPTLAIDLVNGKGGKQDVELSYLSGGLSWKADYVAELSANDGALDLTGWVTLNNNSGAAYEGATMQLVAGDVNQVPAPRERMLRKFTDDSREQMANVSSVSQESLFEYHLYTLNRPTTIKDKQSKQVSLLGASAVPVQKELVLQGNNYYYGASHGDIGQKMKVGVFVQFGNEKKNGLGIPMPKGVVRVYKRDSKGNAQFVGEDSIDHTPNKADVRLKLGEAFDITADKKQTNFKIVDRIMGSRVFDSSYSIKLNNAKKEAVTVIVREPVPGEWTILAESYRHTKPASGTAEWRIKVPAESSKTLTYTARVKY